VAASRQSPIWLVLIIALPVVGWQAFIRYWKYREARAVELKKDAARGDIARAKSAAAERVTEARVAIAAAHATPRSASGPCPIKVPAPPPMNGTAKTSFGNANEAVNAAMGGAAFLEKMTVVRKDELPGLAAANAARWLSEATSLESQLQSTEVPDDFVERAKKVASTQLNWDLVLVVEKETLSLVNLEAKTFTPGTLKGTAYLFDYEKRAVVCLAPVEAENSGSIDVKMITENVDIKLMMDLRQQALARAAESLAAVEK